MEMIPEPTHVGPVFMLMAFLTLSSAVAAISLRNLIHCVLCLVITFGGLAALYLRLDAEFVGLTQIFVYIGGVAILIVFAVLLTRSGDVKHGIFSKSLPLGVGVGVAVAFTLAIAIERSGLDAAPHSAAVSAPVKNIGDALMSEYVVPMEVMALLLTMAMIGAVIIAMQDPRAK